MWRARFEATVRFLHITPTGYYHVDTNLLPALLRLRGLLSCLVRLLRQLLLNLPPYFRRVRQRLTAPSLLNLFQNLIDHLVKLDTRICWHTESGSLKRLVAVSALQAWSLSAGFELMLQPALAG
jgi:hypothetical protein